LLEKGVARVLVTDFGLARVIDDASMTQSGLLAGTPQYMSPEQVTGDLADPRSDLFSLGSVMYAMCSGHSPFRADTVYGTMQRIANDVPRSLRDQNTLVPRWLEGFVLRLLAKEKEQRFENADEVESILEKELAFLRNPTAVSRPTRRWMSTPGPSQRGVRWRLRLAFVAGALILCLVPFAIVTSLNNSSGVISSGPPDGNNEEPSLSNYVDNDTTQFTANSWAQDDDFTATRNRAGELEAEWFKSSAAVDFDRWEFEAAAIREQLNQLYKTEAALSSYEETMTYP
jgi:serine/threonine protein kinase